MKELKYSVITTTNYNSLKITFKSLIKPEPTNVQTSPQDEASTVVLGDVLYDSSIHVL
jgi:hypothetical protein